MISTIPKNSLQSEMRSGRLRPLSEKEDEVDRLVDLGQPNLDSLVTEREVNIHTTAFRDLHLKTYMLMVDFPPSSANCKTARAENILGLVRKVYGEVQEDF